MRLTAELSNLNDQVKKTVPAETYNIMQEATNDLAATNITSKAIGKGKTAPDFILNNVHDKAIQLNQSLNQGPVILKFFRGDW